MKFATDPFWCWCILFPSVPGDSLWPFLRWWSDPFERSSINSDAFAVSFFSCFGSEFANARVVWSWKGFEYEKNSPKGLYIYIIYRYSSQFPVLGTDPMKPSVCLVCLVHLTVWIDQEPCAETGIPCFGLSAVLKVVANWQQGQRSSWGSNPWCYTYPALYSSLIIWGLDLETLYHATLLNFAPHFISESLDTFSRIKSLYSEVAASKSIIISSPKKRFKTLQHCRVELSSYFWAR